MGMGRRKDQALGSWMGRRSCCEECKVGCEVEKKIMLGVRVVIK